MSATELNRIDDLTEKLKDVVRGYHPVTKRLIEETSDLKDPAIVNLHVLLLAELLTMPATVHNVDYKTIMARRKNDRFGKPINHGTKWATDDLRQLPNLFLKGTEVDELAHLFGRTVGSVVGKLREMEVITQEEGERLYSAYTHTVKSSLRDESE